jgi:very-short-patch-repair endonuclease
VVEYDGADHLDPEQSALDARRDARFRVHGLNTVRITRDDINGSRDALIDRLRTAYIDGVSRDVADDRWTLETPPDWVDPNAYHPAS